MKVVEFRRCDNLVVAEILKDDATGYSVGNVMPLAPVAEISKVTEQSSETHFYDNVGAVIIKVEGSDEVTFTVPALELSQLAIVTGKTVDPLTGAYIGNSGTNKMYAVGYRVGLTDGTDRYVWRLKGMFTNVPDEVAQTGSNEINTNNQTVIWTGEKTMYKFAAGGVDGNPDHASEIVIDERDGKADVTKFFDQVVTPDNLPTLAKATTTAISVSPTTDSIEIEETTTITATTTPSGQSVAWHTSNPTIATVENGVVTGVGAGVAVVTAASGNYAASATITVTEPENNG